MQKVCHSPSEIQLFYIVLSQYFWGCHFLAYPSSNVTLCQVFSLPLPQDVIVTVRVYHFLVSDMGVGGRTKRWQSVTWVEGVSKNRFSEWHTFSMFLVIENWKHLSAKSTMGLIDQTFTYTWVAEFKKHGVFGWKWIDRLKALKI